MSINRSLFLLTLMCFLGAFGGCASAPPTGSHSPGDVRSGTDEYDGWLFNSLTGRHAKSAEAQQPAPPATPPAVPPVTSQAAPRIAVM